jgi:hypothetical protein
MGKLRDLPHEIEEPVPILILGEDVPAGEPPIHDMIVSAWVFDAKRSTPFPFLPWTAVAA